MRYRSADRLHLSPPRFMIRYYCLINETGMIYTLRGDVARRCPSSATLPKRVTVDRRFLVRYRTRYSNSDSFIDSSLSYSRYRRRKMAAADPKLWITGTKFSSERSIDVFSRRCCRGEDNYIDLKPPRSTIRFR